MSNPVGPSTLAPKDASLLRQKKAQKHHPGYVKIKVSFNPEKGALCLLLLEGRELTPLGSHSAADPYVKAYIQPDVTKNSKRKSSTKKKALHPSWNEEFFWEITNFMDYMDRRLEISVWDKDSLAKNDFIGRFSIPLNQVLPPNGPKEGWFELLDAEKGKSHYNEIQPSQVGKFLVLYDHTPACAQELLVRKDDLVEVVKEDNEWTLVKHAISGQQGYVPTCFIAPCSSLELEPWYFGPISRQKAEKLLLNPLRKHGCYLIRESESAPGSYSLSMKDGDSVKHFRIEDVKGKYKIQGSPAEPKDNLHALVEFHRQHRSGLGTTLKDPCPKEVPARAADLSYEVKDKWEVPRDSIELVSSLGQGQYGEVYKGMWNKVTPVAVKTLKDKTSCADEFLAEAAIMKQMKHDNLVQLLAVCTIGEPIFIVIELMGHGCLLDYLHSEEGETLRLPTLLDMASDVASGMSFLENNNFIHRDLAARNVLVSENNVCKVGDFGFAKLIKDDVFNAGRAKFPVRWTAPEAISKDLFSIKSDVWSFGVLLYEIITYGGKPYEGLSNKEVIDKVEKGFRMEKPAGCPDGVYTLMLDCWKMTASDRPTFESLYYRLSDFFHSTEANYVYAAKVE